MSNANVAHIQNLYAAFGRGDVAGILAGLTARRRLADGRPAEGFSDARAAQGQPRRCRSSSSLSPNTRTSPTSRRASSMRPTTRSSCSAATALTLKTNGKPIASEWVHVFTLKDGKVARFREHTDTAQFAEAFAAGDKLALARRFIDEVCNGRKLGVADALFSADHALPRSRQPVGRQGTGRDQGRDRRLSSRRQGRALGRPRR